MTWEKAANLDGRTDGPVLYKLPPRPIALFRFEGRLVVVYSRRPTRAIRTALQGFGTAAKRNVYSAT